MEQKTGSYSRFKEKYGINTTTATGKTGGGWSRFKEKYGVQTRTPTFEQMQSAFDQHTSPEYKLKQFGTEVKEGLAEGLQPVKKVTDKVFAPIGEAFGKVADGFVDFGKAFLKDATTSPMEDYVAHLKASGQEVDTSQLKEGTQEYNDFLDGYYRWWGERDLGHYEQYKKSAMDEAAAHNWSGVMQNIEKAKENKFSYWANRMRYSDFARNSGYERKVKGYFTEDQYKHIYSAWPEEQRREYWDQEVSFADALYESINGNYLMFNKLNNDFSAVYANDPLAKNLKWDLIRSASSSTLHLTEDEKKIFNYLFKVEGPEKAIEFLNDMYDTLDARYDQYFTKKTQEWAKEDPFGNSLATVVGAPLRAALGAFGTVTDLIDDGQLEKDAWYRQPSRDTAIIRGAIGDQIRDSWAGNVGGFLYDAGMSAGDSAMNTLTMGGLGLTGKTAQWGSSILTGSDAAVSTMDDALARGLSSGQALTLGLISGLGETVMEKVSLGTILDNKMLDGGVLKNMLKGSAVEGLEEVSTELLNTVADTIISQDKSHWQMAIDAYKEKGLSENEAFWRAVGDKAVELGYNFAAGFAAGGMMTGGNMALHAGQVRENSQAHKALKAYLNEGLSIGTLTTEQIQGMVNEGLALGKDTDSYKLAQEIQKKLDAGKMPKVELIAQLVEQSYVDADGKEGAKPVSLPKLDLNRQSGSNPTADGIAQPAAPEGAVGESAAADMVAPEAMDADGGLVPGAVHMKPEPAAVQYDLDEVYHAATAAKENGTLPESRYEEVLETLGYLQNDMTEGNLTEESYQATLAQVMEMVRPGGVQTEHRAEAEALDTNVQEDVWQTGQELAKALGRDIIFYRGSEGENGKYSDGKIYVNLNASDPVAQVIAHELTHSIEGTKHYDRLKRFVLTELARQNVDIAQARKVKYDQYKSQGVVLDSDAKIDAEIVAEFVQNRLLTNEADIRSLVQAEPGIAKRFWDKIRNWGKRMVGSADSRTAARLEHMEGLYRKAFAESNKGGFTPGSVAVQDGAVAQAQTDSVTEQRRQTEEAYARGELTDEDYDAAMDEFDRAEEERIGRSGEKYSFSEDRSEREGLSSIEINKLTRKKPLAVSKQEWKMIQSQRKSKYANLDEYEIPIVDFFKIGDYRILNNGFVYYIRNTGTDDFTVVMKKQIVPNARRIAREAVKNENRNDYATVDSSVSDEGSNRGFNRGSGERVGNGREFLEDDQGTNEDEHSQRYSNSRQSDTDSRSDLSPNNEPQFSFSGSSIFSNGDSAYMNAVNRGDTDTAQRMVDEAAKAAGFNTPLLFHGTRAFGYTEFDLSKMDDKRSIFLTDNERIASTYSGVIGRRDVSGSHTRDVANLTAAELVEELNSEQFSDGFEDDEKTKYTYMSAQEINGLITDVNSGLEELQERVQHLIRDYADRMAADFDGKDHRTHEQLVKLERMLQSWDYEKIPTQLYMILHHTDAFNSSADEAQKTAKLEQDIRLMRKLSNRENFDGAIVESWLDGYSLKVLSEQQARDKLAVQRKTGNYGLYAKLENPLVIDANGAAWNDIRHWSNSLGITMDSTFTEKRGDMYVLIDKATGNVIDEGSFAVNPYSSQLSLESRHSFMVQKAMNTFSIVTEGMNNTREIAAFAQKRGYDGVIFRNLKDNGGNNVYVGTEEIADIYVVFNPNHVKSADPVVYDDDGMVIPLSERFNEKKSDIRYSLSSPKVKEQGRPLEGWYDSDEKQLQAKKAGYPVLKGEQVVPYATWVRSEERGNYGLVTGKTDDGRLLVSFHNKHDGSMARDVAIHPDMLTPVEGAYQMTKEEFASLMESEPLDVSEQAYTAEEVRELEELFRRSGGEENGTAQPIDMDKLPRKAQKFLNRAKRRMLSSVRKALGVSKFSDNQQIQEAVEQMCREYLTEGRISPETVEQLFQQAYENGIMINREMLDQFQDVRDQLRGTAVTLSDTDKSNIPDFGDFRKRNAFRLRIVDKGGMPVDSFYLTLNDLSPMLFPESITHPADQLVRMAEVAQSLAISKQSLDEYYGPERETFKAWARNDFECAASELMNDLYTIRRYAEDRSAEKAKPEVPKTAEEAMEVYRKLKKARRQVDKATAKNLLTEHDQMQVGRLLRHEIELQHLDPETDNVEGITAIYKAKREYEELSGLIAGYKRSLHSKLRQNADRLLETANTWKDKKAGILYARETMERNVFDIVKDRQLAQEIVDAYFTPVHKAEAAATRMKNEYRNRIRALNLSRKATDGNLVSEAHAVQLLGEAEDNIRLLENARGRIEMRDGKTLEEWRAVVAKLWAENPKLDKTKIRDAVSKMRDIYDELFVQMNRVRVANGYEPINYRSGYFPHFQPGESDGVLAMFGRALGIDTQVVALPTTINGLTHTFKPGMQWFGNAQERLGFNTAYDAVEGFDKYIEGAAGVIHQTENIQRLRALATQIRYRTSEDGLKEQVDAVWADDRLTDEEKQIKIQDIYANGKYTLGNFVAELDEYTNLLANKKSKYDRSIEALMGRRCYTLMKWLESRVGANMIAGNVSSALTNFIPLTQAGARLDKRALMKGMWQTLKAMKTDDGMVGESTFLTNRRGSDPLVQTWGQKASSKAGWLMDHIDQFVSGSVVRGAYYHNMKRGMSHQEAINQADSFAAGVMADRSKGAMPTLFQSSNPLYKLFTQFQLEVNNQFSEVFKDLPRSVKGRGVMALSKVLFQYFIGAWLFNELFEKLFGRRPALDPIDLLLGLGKDMFDEDVGFGEGVSNFGKNALGELPFSSGLTLFGVETDGGRFPVSSAIPNASKMWDAVTEKDWSGKKRFDTFIGEAQKPLTYLALPFGGNQAAKIYKGMEALIRGGSYSVDKDGNDILQYPVYNDSFGDAVLSSLRALIMGKSSLPEAQDWVENGFDSLGAKETSVYKAMLEAGVQDREAFGLIQELGSAKKSGDKSREAVQREMLVKSDAPEEAKALAYFGLLASDSGKALMMELGKMEANLWEVSKVLIANSDANNLTGAEASCAKRDAIANAALTDEEKVYLYEHLISESRVEEYKLFQDAGLDFGQFVEAHNQYARINGMDMDTKSKATAFSHWVENQGFTAKQEEVVRESFLYRISLPVTADRYEKLLEAGLTSENAYELAEQLDDLEPETGTDKVTDVQRWRACVEFSYKPGTQLAALAGVMDDSQLLKARVAYEMDVNPDTYVTLKERLPEYDLNHDGSMTNAEVKAAVDSMTGLSYKQKAVLWQLNVNSKSAKNNPYSTVVGQQVLDAKNEG